MIANVGGRDVAMSAQALYGIACCAAILVLGVVSLLIRRRLLGALLIVSAAAGAMLGIWPLALYGMVPAGFGGLLVCSGPAPAPRSAAGRIAPPDLALRRTPASAALSVLSSLFPAGRSAELGR
jgi:hypothetical protein